MMICDREIDLVLSNFISRRTGVLCEGLTNHSYEVDVLA